MKATMKTYGLLRLRVTLTVKLAAKNSLTFVASTHIFSSSLRALAFTLSRRTLAPPSGQSATVSWCGLSSAQKGYVVMLCIPSPLSRLVYPGLWAPSSSELSAGRLLDGRLPAGASSEDSLATPPTPSSPSPPSSPSSP
jgi:hypothetical protein